MANTLAAVPLVLSIIGVALLVFILYWIGKIYFTLRKLNGLIDRAVPYENVTSDLTKNILSDR